MNKKPKAINLRKASNQTTPFKGEGQPPKSEQKFTAVGNKRFDFSLFPDASGLLPGSTTPNTKTQIIIQKSAGIALMVFGILLIIIEPLLVIGIVPRFTWVSLIEDFGFFAILSAGLVWISRLGFKIFTNN